MIALQAGRATLEIINSAQRRLIDEVEVGRQVSRQIRVGFEVDDTVQATEQLVTSGATLIAGPTETPWRSLNSRLEAPAGLQLTLFEELDEDQLGPWRASGPVLSQNAGPWSSRDRLAHERAQTSGASAQRS